MDNKIDDILQRYPLKVVSQKRARGAVMLCAEGGTYIIKKYEGSIKKLHFQKLVQDKLLMEGYDLIDEIIVNNDGELSCKDNRGDVWIVKRWHQGEECNIRDIREVCLAASNMAMLHQKMMLETDEDNLCYEKTDLYQLFLRHNREMKRVHSYIKEKKRKNDMEIKLLNSYNMFYSQGEDAVSILKDSEYSRIREYSFKNQCVVHGNYTYHNVFFKDNQIITTGFERCAVGVQIVDLYDFIRKVMEKNSWDIDMGLRVIDSYFNVRKPSDNECRLLYTLLIYPEKYWKLINFYYNSRKTWMSEKNNEKLGKICEQEKERLDFLESVKSLLF